jgi:peptidyl-prolyl cis-trans isomerase A (cyclophilin A)
MRIRKPVAAGAMLASLFACISLPVMAEDDVHVVLETALGDIRIAVYPDRAPVSAGSFLEFVDRGLAQEASFYRSVRRDNDRGTPTIEVIQGGLTGDEEALPPVAHESTADTGIEHRDGTVSLARADPGTASGATFFICIGEQPALDHGGMRNPDGQGFAAFGQVVEGMDVVRAIHALPSDGPTDEPYFRGQLITEPVAITGARRVSGNSGEP